MIDTSGCFAKGFDAKEAYSLLELCINANNLGETGYTWQANDWTPIYPAVDKAPAQVVGPWDNARRLWKSHVVPETYAVVIRGTVETSHSILAPRHTFIPMRLPPLDLNRRSLAV